MFRKNIRNNKINRAKTAIDYTGIFPSFAIGSNSYSIAITGGSTSWQLMQTIVYYPNYI